MAGRANNFVNVANGGTPALDTSGALPVWPVRLMVGAAPYSATGGSDCCDAISQAAYYSRRLADSVLQTLTAPQEESPCGPRPSIASTMRRRFSRRATPRGGHGGQMASLHRPRAYPWISPGQASNRRRWQDR